MDISLVGNTFGGLFFSFKIILLSTTYILFYISSYKLNQIVNVCAMCT